MNGSLTNGGVGRPDDGAAVFVSGTRCSIFCHKTWRHPRRRYDPQGEGVERRYVCSLQVPGQTLPDNVPLIGFGADAGVLLAPGNRPSSQKRRYRAGLTFNDPSRLMVCILPPPAAAFYHRGVVVSRLGGGPIGHDGRIRSVPAGGVPLASRLLLSLWDVVAATRPIPNPILE